MDGAADGIGRWQGIGGRIVLTAIGALAGWSGWFLADRADRILTDPQAWLFAAAFTAGFFGALMALVGPLRPGRALVGALAASLPAAGLLTWASLRHETLEGFFAQPEHGVAWLVVVTVPLPYLIAALRPGTRWRDYPTLFGEGWGIVVRLLAAWLFAGLAWVVVFLSDRLLRLVGIDFIKLLLEVDPAPWVLTGAMAGLALAVVNELSDYLSPFLMVRLLRVLLPPVLVVVALFSLAVLVQGMGEIFGGFSPAATLITLAAIVATLVSTALDAEDATAVESRFMRASARALALLLPVVAGIGLWAVAERIGQHGLSPARLAAALLAGVLCLYGAAYAASALSGRGWMARIRAANTWLAPGVIALAALWLSPALHAERLAAEDQRARLEDGRLTPDRIDLWALRHDWGRAGQAVLAAIAEGADETLAARLAALEAAPDRYSFDFGDPGQGGSALAALLSEMPVRPEAAAPQAERLLGAVEEFLLAGYLQGCREPTAGGTPGCVLVVADLLPDEPGEEAAVFYKRFGLLGVDYLLPGPAFRRAAFGAPGAPPLPDYRETDAVIEALHAGDFAVGPARINAVEVGGRQFAAPF